MYQLHPSLRLVALLAAAWFAFSGCSNTPIDATPVDAGQTSGEDDGGTSASETGTAAPNDATTSMEEDGSSASSDDGSSGCSSTHRKVGWTATLEMKDHDVSGTARIADDCTIVIENFSYDGGGLQKVQIYGSDKSADASGAFENGYAISDNLRGTSYDGDRFVAELPDGKSLDDLKEISVWCVEANVDFGSGTFSK